MKKKKVSEKENEWKGILQDELPKGYELLNKNPNIVVPNYTKHLSGWKDMIESNMFKNNIFKKEVDLDCQEKLIWFHQVKESNITPDSFTVTNINGNDYDIDKSWNEFIKDKQLQDKEEEYCNVGVNKDWDNEKWVETLSKFVKEEKQFNNPYKSKPVKDKRIDFEFTPLTFWQLLPSIAVNLHCKEIELTWLCFGMYINFKRNG